jgi:hypothetical protein
MVKACEFVLAYVVAGKDTYDIFKALEINSLQ